MKIEAFVIMWNEADILPLVIKHYKKFCDHITFFDNYSTDDSQFIAESMGCTVLKFGKPGVLSDQAYLDVKNHAWKSSDADFVIVCDCDEILLGIPALLECSRATIFRTQGWDVHSNEMPVNDITEITTGFRFDNYSKSIVFSPKHIKEINYKPGCHACNPIGNIVYSQYTLMILHVNAIGGVERRIKRYRDYVKRMSPENRRNGWGCHYWQPEAQTRREFAERLAKSKPLL